MPIFFIIFPIFFCIILVMSFSFFISVFSATLKRNNIRNFFKNNVVLLNDKAASRYSELRVPLSRIAEANITDMKALEDYLYDIFYRFEDAYNSLDYNTMSTLSTSKLYNNYYTDITLNLKIGNRRTIKDIERKNIYVYDFYSSDERQMFYAYLTISYKNYVEDKNGNVISGTKDENIEEEFEVVFTKKHDSSDVIKCPNCGATVLGSTCTYCRTNLRNQDFKIDSIKRIVVKETI